MIPHIDIVVSALSALVYVLLVFKTRAAFVLGFLNQGFWLAFMVQTGSYGLSGSIGFFAVTNLYGLWRWTRYPPKRQRWLRYPAPASEGVRP